MGFSPAQRKIAPMYTWFVAPSSLAQSIAQSGFAQEVLARAALWQATAPPELTQEEQIRINFHMLLIVSSLAAATILTIYLLNRWSGKKRYAAHLAQLEAEGRLDRRSALSEVANAGGRAIVTDDGQAAGYKEEHKASVFGENYRSVDMSGAD